MMILFKDNTVQWTLDDGFQSSMNQTFQMLYSNLCQRVVMKIALKSCVQCNVFKQDWSS